MKNAIQNDACDLFFQIQKHQLPQNVKFEPITSTSLRVTWEKKLEKNGEILGYYVVINPSIDSDGIYYLVPIDYCSGEYCSFEFKALKEQEQYSII